MDSSPRPSLWNSARSPHKSKSCLCHGPGLARAVVRRLPGFGRSFLARKAAGRERASPIEGGFRVCPHCLAIRLIGCDVRGRVSTGWKCNERVLRENYNRRIEQEIKQVGRLSTVASPPAILPAVFETATFRSSQPRSGQRCRHIPLTNLFRRHSAAMFNSTSYPAAVNISNCSCRVSRFFHSSGSQTS
jgi:hypothetical protein